jgi:hypothetical protein
MTPIPASSIVTMTLRVPADLSAADLLLEMKYALMSGITLVDLDRVKPEVPRHLSVGPISTTLAS